MKILYISPENTVGTLGLWKRLHELRGNYCRTVTLFPSDLGFADDICLKLPLVGPMPWYRRLRNMAYQRSKGPLGDLTDLPGNPPVWQPGNGAERAFFAIRDWLWRFKVEPAIKKYDLLDFDVYHFEWGMEFYRHGGFVKRLEQLGKPMIAHYHGQDFRNRGVIPAVDSRVRASLTSEYDLIPRHTNMRYLFLPYDVSAGKPKTALHDPITICHATRSRYFKGSDKIIDVCQRLEKSHGIRFILIENQPHAETMELKRQADIYVDQIADVAPGYGMNSVETMALGVACCTSMDDAYQQFMPGHPFINVNAENLEKRLLELVQNPGRIMEYGRKAREWAEKRHSLEAVGDQLYRIYAEIGVVD